MNYLILLLGFIAVGFSGPFNTIMVQKMNFSGVQTGSCRLILAALILMLAPSFWRALPQIIKIKKTLFLGAFFLALHFYLWTSAFEYTSLSSAVIFLCAQPLISIVMTIKDKNERPQKAQYIGMFFGTIGMFLIAAGDWELSPSYLIGDLMVVIAGVAIVAFQLITRKSIKQINFIAFNTSVWGGAGLILLLVALLQGHEWSLNPESGWEIEEGYATILGLAVVSTLIGHGSFNYVIPRIKLILLNIGILLEPVLGVIFGTLMGLDQWPQGFRLLGSVLVVLGVAVALLGDKIRKGKI